jgi:hypothetical protein
MKPSSDHKTCFSLRPEDLNAEKTHSTCENQPKILMNAMIKAIRKDTLRCVDERLILKDKQPKAMDNIISGGDLRLGKNFSAQTRSFPVPFGASFKLNTGPLKSGRVPISSAPYSVCILLPPENSVAVAKGCIYRHPRKELFGQVPSSFDHFMDDSDEEGGISL